MSDPKFPTEALGNIANWFRDSAMTAHEVTLRSALSAHAATEKELEGLRAAALVEINGTVGPLPDGATVADGVHILADAFRLSQIEMHDMESALADAKRAREEAEGIARDCKAQYHARRDALIAAESALASERDAHERTRAQGEALAQDWQLQSDLERRGRLEAESRASALAARVGELEDDLAKVSAALLKMGRPRPNGSVAVTTWPRYDAELDQFFAAFKVAKKATVRPAAGATPATRRETYDAAEDQKDREACPIQRCGYSPCGGCKCEGACLACHPEPAAGATTEHDGEEGERG